MYEKDFILWNLYFIFTKKNKIKIRKKLKTKIDKKLEKNKNKNTLILLNKPI